MLTILEASLIAAYYETREAFVEAARHREGDTPETWEARMEAARQRFVEAEREVVLDIIANGDIETPEKRYSVRWVHDLREFRLRVDQVIRIIRLMPREDTGHAA